ncbi:MAG: desulfoferrodoxin [Oscillospiraceae bacterium]|jgi:superoxide reductase|nr:desulfoferrodoxin [Oscillospiraceae bacterium]
MKYEKKFYRCSHCGNIISFVENAGVSVLCCGEKMQEIKPNATDAAQEKHVPVGVREGNKLTVTVGSVEHPMTEAHHIAWIVVAEKDRTQRAELPHTGAPSAEFYVGGDIVTVYEYCNLHGLWVADL